MPTPSDNAVETGSRGAKTTPRPRSVFSNFSIDAPETEASLEITPERQPAEPSLSRHVPRRADQPTGATLQAGIDTALARAFIYRFLAAAFADPTTEGWQWLGRRETHDALQSALGVLERGDEDSGTSVPPVLSSAENLQSAAISAPPVSAAPRPPTPKSELGQPQRPEATPNHKPAAPFQARRDAGPTFRGEDFDAFRDAYLAAFGHAARGRCPLNEIEYGDLKADPLFQPHRLADLAAFYRAFGLEVAEDAGERHDHVSLELEFMSVLAAKEAYALEHQLDADALAQCRDAQTKFLREHLGRWTPAFARRLARLTDHATLRALAEFTRGFVADECARFGVPAGSEDLLLRSVDPAAESLCTSCGITHLPPGALRTDAVG